MQFTAIVTVAETRRDEDNYLVADARIAGTGTAVAFDHHSLAGKVLLVL